MLRWKQINVQWISHELFFSTYYIRWKQQQTAKKQQNAIKKKEKSNSTQWKANQYFFCFGLKTFSFLFCKVGSYLFCIFIIRYFYLRQFYNASIRCRNLVNEHCNTIAKGGSNISFVYFMVCSESLYPLL